MKKEYIAAFLFYLLASIFFLRGILISPGVLIGSDWGLPINPAQMYQVYRGAFWAWTNEGNLLGFHLITLNDALFRLFLGLLSVFQVSGEWLTKGLAIFLLSAPGLSLYCLCRHLKCPPQASFLAGLFYLTTPPVFNYLSMGWIYVLLSFVLLPLGLITFEKSVKKRSIGYAVVTALIYSLALFQLQALSWFAVVFVLSSIFLVTSRQKLGDFLRSLVFVFLLTFLFNCYWIVPTFFEQGLQSSVSSYDFARFGIRLNPLDMLRLWGSIYNFQFETALPKNLVVFSFLLPILVYTALILRNKNRRILFFATLSFVPLGIFWARQLLLFIPYSNIFRDYSRNFILSVFAYSVLLAFTLDWLYKHLKKAKFLVQIKKNILSFIFISSFIGINILIAYPFWNSGLSKKAEHQRDVRLKTIQFSPEYQRVEEWLAEKEGEFKVLWLPTGGVVAFWDKPQTAGPYGAIWDLFAGLARKPGGITITDKVTGPKRDFAEVIQRNIYVDKNPYLADILSLANIKYLVVRLNSYSDPNKPPMETIYHKLKNDDKFQEVLVDGSVVVFENKKFLFHFYPSQNIIYLDGDIKSLSDVVSFDNWSARSAIFLADNTDEIQRILMKKANEFFIEAKLENAISEKKLAKNELHLENIAFPYIRWKPGSLIYPLVLKKEQFYEWRARKNKEELLDKKLFYAGKRISEIEKWGKDIDLDRALEEYKKKMEEAMSLLKEDGWRDKQTLQENILKTETFLKAHWRKIISLDFNEERMEKTKDGFEELKVKIEELKPKIDFSGLVYNFEIPLKGNYKLYIRNENVGSYFESEPLKPLNFILDEKESKVEGKLRSDGWVEFGEMYFNPGGHKLVLLMPQAKNLVEESKWQIIEEVYQAQVEGQEKVIRITRKPIVVYESLGISLEAKGYLQEIKEYQPGALYRLTLDCSSNHGLAGLAIEEVFEEKEKEPGVLLKGFFSRTEKGKFERFEIFFESSPGVKKAMVYLFSKESNKDIDVRFKNIQVERIFEPKVIWRSEIEKQEKQKGPKITFVKINPTKYKVQIEGAKEPYTLVFSESFHQGWKAYISDQWSVIGDQQYGETVASYFDEEIKEWTHKDIFLDRDTFETWGEKPIPEERHLLVNGYANSWYVTPEDAGGKENYELIIEFWPQRLFYIGLGFSLVTLLSCLGYLGFSFVKNKIKQ